MAMNRTELRPGNYVNIPTGEYPGKSCYRKIETVDWEHITTSAVDEDPASNQTQYKRVPLTVVHPIYLSMEWIKRFGWEKLDGPNEGEIYFHKNGLVVKYDLESYLIIGNKFFKIESVHHLQNLYFDLTKEELQQTT